MIKRNFRITVVFLFGLCLGGCNAPQKYSSADSEGWVTLSSLMDEMGDLLTEEEKNALYVSRSLIMRLVN